MSWPLLLLYGVWIAVVSGTIGGFIGKAISKSHDHGFFDKNPTTPTNTSDTSNILDTPYTLDTSNTTTGEPSSCILPIPKTGCTSISQRQYISSTSAFEKIDYATICALRWTDPHLAAISAATP
jgi:hypothetical protein